ncbi:hypothetical protein PRZ48_006446 [Zasmidium cellare]|uniref:Heterokaryon incompatibility domain-containing protein n=1 Tax=Zasmidium cellare TaxID=395010 RepID=A0ABR0EN56_ZASCE|nr:hypothetical protein PRZ48_006446 [Zasmidium cellare]
MDHLPIPQQPDGWSVTVPYVCKTAYDHGDFLTYPDRAGPQWKHVLPREGQPPFFLRELNHPSDRGELRSFLQCWIFFGLLHEVLSPFGLYDESEYHEHNGGEEILHTRRLSGRIEEWRKETALVPPEEHERRKRRLVECLVLSLQTLQCFLIDPDGSCEIRSRLGPDAPLRNSLLAICITISRMGEMAFKVLPELDWPEFNLRPGFSENEKHFLKERNWCPSAIAREDAALAPVFMRHYMMHMQQPKTTLDHGGCTEDGCTTVQIDDDCYTPRHARNHCQCELIGPDEAEVATCLEDGTFPVFEVTGQTLDDVELKIQPYSKNITYVALSHIWADGLGNPKATSLRRCQLLRLRGLADDLQQTDSYKANDSTSDIGKKFYIWCDTLLCPIQIPDPSKEMTSRERETFRQQPVVARSRKLKQLALAKMKEVYTKASYVLVLDQELEAARFSDLDDVEALIRIVTSRWMQRLWTFQEAVLAETLLFQFADRVVDLVGLNRSVKASWNDSPMLRALCKHPLSRAVAIRPFQYLMEQGGMSIVFFQVAVRNRLMKYMEDEPLVSATVLNLDAEQVARAETLEQRMMIFWKLLSEKASMIPASVCFNTCDRIDRKGYRWAPITLRRPFAKVAEHFFASDDDQKRGKLTAFGLQVALPGWRVKTGLSPYGVYQMALKKFAQINMPLYVRTENGKWVTISERSDPNGDGEKVATPWQVIATDDTKDWRIMLDDRSRYDGKGKQGLLGFMETATDGKTQVFRFCYIVDVADVEEHHQTITNASQEHAVALARLSCFKRLQWYVLIDVVVGVLARSLPLFIQSLIGRISRQTVGRLAHWDMVKFVAELKRRDSTDGQTDDRVKAAMLALERMNGRRETIVVYIMMHFFGKLLRVEETFGDDHVWIVD